MASTHGDYRRDSFFTAALEYHLISFSQPCFGKTQAAVPVIEVGIGAGLKESQIRHGWTNTPLEFENWKKKETPYLSASRLTVVLPAFNSNTWTQALFLGMLFGLVTYATFDLTNLALLKGWPTVIVVLDILLGMFLSSAFSIAGYFISKWLQ